MELSTNLLYNELYSAENKGKYYSKERRSVSAGQKIAVSLLISVILFAAFTVAAFAGLFSFVEARFYQPLVVKNNEQRLKNLAEKEEEYSEVLNQRFAAFAAKKETASYATAAPTVSDQKNRTNLTGTLFSQTPSLMGIRIIDKNGRNIHYSSFAADEKFRSKGQVSYKNYGELQDLPFEVLSCEDVRSGTGVHHRIVREQKKNRILYSYPFYDVYSAYRGTIVFYCDASDFNRFLSSQNTIALNENFVLISNEVSVSEENKGGYVYGLPLVGQDLLTSTLIEKIRGKKASSLEKIAATQDGNWLAFIYFNQDGTFIARFIKDEALLFSLPVRVLLLAIVFLTLFLVIYLIFNLRHDDMVVIKDRIRRFQIAFIEEYTEKSEAGTLKLLPADLEKRKLTLNEEIRQSLGKRGQRHSAEVNALLERSWNEIMGTVSQTHGLALAKPSTDTAEIKRMLEEVLGSGKLPIQAAPQTTQAKTAVSPAAERPKTVENLAGADDAEELDEVESLEDVESLDEAEPLDDAEELDEVEPLEDAEELDEAEPLKDVESLDEVEPLDDAEVLDEAEPLEDAEELDEAEPLEDAEELDEAEPLEDAEELDEAEPLKDAETLDEAETLENAESLDEAEPLEDAEELDEVESLDDAEVLDETEPLDDSEELDEAEPLEDAEEPDDVKSPAENEKSSLPIENKASSESDSLTEEEPMEEIEMLNEDEALIFSSPDGNDDENSDADDDLEFFEVVSPEEMFAVNSDNEPIPSKEVLEKPLQEPEELPVLESREAPSRSRFSFWNFGRNDTPVTEVLSDSEENTKTHTTHIIEKSSKEPAMEKTHLEKKPAETIQEDASGIYHIAEDLPLNSMTLDEKFKQLVDSVLG